MLHKMVDFLVELDQVESTGPLHEAQQNRFTRWLIGGKTNVDSLIPFRTSTQGNFDAVYKLTGAEASQFSRAWGFQYSRNPYQWYKGSLFGQSTYMQNGVASWAQRATELQRASIITGSVGGLTWGALQAHEWWKRR